MENVLQPWSKKKANEVIFSRKSGTLSLPPLTFNNNNNDLTKSSHQKHLGIVLDSESDFSIHTEQKLKMRNKVMGFMRRFAISLPRKSLLIIH